MKKMKKLASLLLALVMTLAMAMPVFATEVSGPENTKGSITITDSETVKVSNRTFNAYKVLDVQLLGADKDGNQQYVYTVPDALKSWYAAHFNVDASAKDFSALVAKAIGALDAAGVQQFATDVLKAAKENGIEPVTATGEKDATSVIFADIPLGYYVVEDATIPTGTEVVSALMLDTTDPNPSITIKADAPKIDKKIVEDDNTRTETSNASIGDIVNFELTSKVPDMTGYKKYVFVVDDTMSKGLTFNNDIVITLGGKTLTAGTDYVVTVKPETEPDKDADRTETKIEIVFQNFIQYLGEPVIGADEKVTYPNNQAGAEIVITYSATLNSAAVIGVAGNPNEVKLTYSNNPNKDFDGDPNNPKPEDKEVLGVTPSEKTKTYVTGIELTKVDPNLKALTGAKFNISGDKLNVVLVNKMVYEEDENGTWYRLKDGTYTETVPEDSTEKQYENTSVKYSLVEKITKETKPEKFAAEGYVNSEGKLVFEGLAEGTYTITELIAPDGYNALDGDITVTITWGDPEDPESDCTWEFSAKHGEEELIEEANKNGNLAAFKVVNKAGSLLPSTGGIGTTIFYVVGTILVLGAGILLVTKRRMKAQ